MQYPFPHERLDVYHRSLDLAELTQEICQGLPKGNSHLKDQLMRSGCAVCYLISEGANRYAPNQKRQRFIEAQGECGEATATVDVMARLQLIQDQKLQEFRALSGRIGAMLTGLIKRYR